MYLQTHAHDLINVSTGELDPTAAKLLHMFPHITALDHEFRDEHVLRNGDGSSHLEICYGGGDETTKQMVELALLKAGVPMIANPFATA